MDYDCCLTWFHNICVDRVPGMNPSFMCQWCAQYTRSAGQKRQGTKDQEPFILVPTRPRRCHKCAGCRRDINGVNDSVVICHFENDSFKNRAGNRQATAGNQHYHARMTFVKANNPDFDGKHILVQNDNTLPPEERKALNLLGFSD